MNFVSFPESRLWSRCFLNVFFKIRLLFSNFGPFFTLRKYPIDEFFLDNGVKFLNFVFVCICLIKVQQVCEFLILQLVFRVVFNDKLYIKVAIAHSCEQERCLSYFDHLGLEAGNQIICHRLNILACFFGFSVSHGHVHGPSVRVKFIFVRPRLLRIFHFFIRVSD